MASASITTGGSCEADRPATEMVQQEMEAYLSAHPSTELIDAFFFDFNGIPRGKRLPATAFGKLYNDGLCLPASTVALDVWGTEVLDSGLVFETGDRDWLFRPVPGSLRPLPWAETPTAQVLVQMEPGIGAACESGDPRNVLAHVVRRFTDMGLTPVVAVELEFRLLDVEPDHTGRPQLPRIPQSGQRLSGSQLLGLDELDAFSPVFDEIREACRLQGVETETLIAEQAEAHYEINLVHRADALEAADQAMLFKRTVRQVAAKHGMIGCFMAKPFGDEPGNGMHVHFSLLDEHGNNLFDDGSDIGSPELRRAAAGLLALMSDSTAIFAPHANSYRRFQMHAHVPMAPSWGYDNRTVAVRVPLSKEGSTHIEHRVAGADANPYLVVAAILAAAHHGMSRVLQPPAPTTGDAYTQHPPSLPASWEEACTRFERSRELREYLGDDFMRLFAALKRQEVETLKRRVTLEEYAAYLRTV